MSDTVQDINEETQTTRRDRKPLRPNRTDPVFTQNRTTTATVESTGLVNRPQLSQVPGRVPYGPAFVSKTRTDTNSSTDKESGSRGQRSEVRGHSGCTCERLQGHVRQKQFTPMMTAQTHAKGGRGNRLCRYLPANREGGGGVNEDGGEREGLANIRGL